MDTLTARDKDILRLAVAPFKYPAARERQAGEDFELSGVRFWQEVNRLASQPEAYAWDPHVVGQLIDKRTHRDRPRLTTRII